MASKKVRTIKVTKSHICNGKRKAPSSCPTFIDKFDFGHYVRPFKFIIQTPS